jgi:hypothetical protein
MYYDLNVSYIANQAELQRTLAFLAECQSSLFTEADYQR